LITGVHFSLTPAAEFFQAAIPGGNITLAESLYQLHGFQIREEDLPFIRDAISRHQERGRTAISRVLCEHWDWRHPNGQLKGMACRTLLLKTPGKQSRQPLPAFVNNESSEAPQGCSTQL